LNRLTPRALCFAVHHAARQTSNACDTARIDAIDPVSRMNDVPVCPQCGSTFCYQERGLFACPECAQEWTANDAAENTIEAQIVKKA
jgi:ribosomal protein L37AE/L43A